MFKQYNGCSCMISEPATFPLASSSDESAAESDVPDDDNDSIRTPARDSSADVTPIPSDEDEDLLSEIEALKRADEAIKRDAMKLPAKRQRAKSQQEQEAALALLRMHEVSAEEKARQRQLAVEREQRLRTARDNVQREHCYMWKGDHRKRPRDPLPTLEDVAESDVTDSASEGEPDMIPCLPSNLTHDHQYCTLYHPIDYAEQYRRLREKYMGKHVRAEDYYSEPQPVLITDIAADVDISTIEVIPKFVNRGKLGKRKGVCDITNLKGSRELASLLPQVEKPKPKYKPRTIQEQVQIAYEFLVKGIDQEDTNYLKRRYDELLQDDSPQTAWLNNVHWVDHCHTAIPDPPVKKRRKAEEELRKHETGLFVCCAARFTRYCYVTIIHVLYSSLLINSE